jgi:phosphohistidine phosphatase
MMNLYVLRHGIAADPTSFGLTADADRRLTLEGERKVRQVAQAMQALELSFDLILSSPYLRARQTAEIIAEAFKASKKLEFNEALAPGGSSKKLIELLNRRQPAPESVLLSGHEPDLSELISLLLSGNEGLSITMKKGGLCKLTIQTLKHGRCASLEWLLTPKQMGLMH